MQCRPGESQDDMGASRFVHDVLRATSKRETKMDLGLRGKTGSNLVVDGAISNQVNF